MMKKNEKNESDKRAGGAAFFFSFLVLIFFSAFSAMGLFKLFAEKQNFEEWRFFVVGILLGLYSAKKLIRGKMAVFIHELKHAIISNLVGNKWKGFVVKNNSGHFEYAYSDDTARFNAFVSIAPYWLPLFTFTCGIVASILTYKYRQLLIIIISFLYGMDLELNFRDLSPRQTDLTGIKGGYLMSFTYLIFINLFLFLLIATWVEADTEGIKFLFFDMLALFKRIVGIN